MDATDRELAEIMIGQMEANLDYLRATPDTPYCEFAYVLDRIAYWSRKMDALTFGSSSYAGCSR